MATAGFAALLLCGGCGPSGWTGSTLKDTMTDKTNVLLRMPSEEDEQSELLVRCMNGKSDVVVVTRDKIAADDAEGVSLAWRFDDASPQSGTGETLVGEEGVILADENAVSFIQRLEKANRLAVRIEGSEELTLTFDVAGLDEEMRPYGWACSWKDIT